MHADAHSIPWLAEAFQVSCFSPHSLGSRDSPLPLTPFRANEQLGHSECKDAACRNGHHLLPALVAFAFTLKDGYGIGGVE